MVERTAQAGDRAVHRVVADEGAFPDRVDQRLAVHRATALLGEPDQQRHHSGLEPLWPGPLVVAREGQRETIDPPLPDPEGVAQRRWGGDRRRRELVFVARHAVFSDRQLRVSRSPGF
jgi:hypothetical protein